MKSRKIRATDPETLDRQGTKKHKGDVTGAFKVWARELPGHHAFLLAMLKNGLFEFSDLKQYAELQVLRQQALRACQVLPEAKKFRTWRENG